jgi:tetratricopeptide (TPR) repeat protein
MEEALRRLNEEIGSNPDAPLSLTLRADILEADGEYEEAYASLKQAFNAVLGKKSDSDEFIEPPSYLVERMNHLRKLIKK